MEFTFLCSSNEKKIYEESIGKEATVSINGLQSRGIVKAVDGVGNVILETDSEISEILRDKLSR